MSPHIRSSYLPPDPRGRLRKLIEAGIYPYGAAYYYDATLSDIKHDFSAVTHEPQPIEVSMLVRVVDRVQEGRNRLRFECEALSSDAGASFLFFAENLSATGYRLAQDHLLLGDLILVEISSVLRDQNSQFCLMVNGWEMVAPNLVDFDDPTAFEERQIALAGCRLPIDRRSKLLGKPPHFFNSQSEPRNVTDGSTHIPINQPNMALWDAVATTGRPAFMVVVVPGQAGFEPSLVYDVVLFASDLIHPLDGQLKPYAWILDSMGKHARDLCGSSQIQAKLRDEGDDQIDPCTIEISKAHRVIAFSDLMAFETGLDFPSFSSVEEAVQEARRLLPDDGTVYPDIESVILAAARHSVFPTLMRPTVVHSFPSKLNPFARYEDADGAACAHAEIFINGQLVAVYAEEENHVLAISPECAHLVHLLNYGIGPTVRVQWFVDVFLSLFTRGAN